MAKKQKFFRNPDEFLRQVYSDLIMGRRKPDMSLICHEAILWANIAANRKTLPEEVIAKMPRHLLTQLEEDEEYGLIG